MRDDRHGRLDSPSVDARRRPHAGFRARDLRRFGRLLDDALSRLPAPASEALEGARVEIRDVPEVGDLPGGTAGVGPAAPGVPLALALARDDRVHHLVVHRRPAELRAADRDDLVEVLHDAVLDAIADALGLDPEWWDEP